MFKNDNGFTLIEVLVSLTLLTSVVLVASSFFNQSNTISSYNNQKLVAVNLARATLERIQLSPDTYITDGLAGGPYNYKKCINRSKPSCENYQVKINNHEYAINVSVSQDKNEQEIDLVDVRVDVTLAKKPTIETSVEGYVKHAAISP
ncbi:type IV pilus modification PilV family protein [Alkalihalobacillus sp. CinArs1]|uniref:type IV pilus modification PilV family protein n=1 Tax=Alkalihalobacillus sp. CinArs1 TaxID=2995314 RepID=UPI0022DDF796|nr:prepilin-type N-terminal cleavage/methylation domain-containing protein [Alkalihalobacillus sp. CinArs1]